MSPVLNVKNTCPVGNLLAFAGRQTDRRTDVRKLIGTFSDLAKVPENSISQLLTQMPSGELIRRNYTLPWKCSGSSSRLKL